MTATNVPALACGEMFVGLGASTRRVDFRDMSVSEVASARSAYNAAGVQVDVFGNKIKTVPRAQGDVEALKKATAEKKTLQIAAEARLTVANKAAQEATDKLSAAKEDAFKRNKALTEQKAEAAARKAAADKDLADFIQRSKDQDDAQTRAILAEKQKQAEYYRLETQRLQAQIDREKVEQAKYQKKLQTLVDMAKTNAARAAYLAQDARLQFNSLVGMSINSNGLALARTNQKQMCDEAAAATNRMAGLQDAVAKSGEALKDAETDSKEARVFAESNSADEFAHARSVSASKNFEQAQKNFAQANRDLLTAEGQVTARKNACQNAGVAVRKLEAEELKKKHEDMRLQQAALVKAAADAEVEAKRKADQLQKKCREEIAQAEALMEANRKALRAANILAVEVNTKNEAGMRVAEAERQIKDAKSDQEVKTAQSNLATQQIALTQASAAADKAADFARQTADAAEATRKRAEAATKARRDAERARNDKIISDMEDAQEKARQSAKAAQAAKNQAIIDMATRDSSKQQQLEMQLKAAEEAAKTAERNLKAAQDELVKRQQELRDLEKQKREVEKLLEIALKELALAETSAALEAAQAKVTELRAKVADLTRQVNAARAAVVVAQQVVDAKRIELEKRQQAVRLAEDAENQRTVAAAAKLADAEKKRQEETRRVMTLQAELDRKFLEDEQRRQAEYNAKTKAANEKLATLQRAEQARRAELQVIETKITQTQRLIDEATQAGKNGEAELLRLKQVQQTNEAKRKQEEVRLAQVAVAAYERSIAASKNLTDAQARRKAIEEENARKAAAHKAALDKKTKQLNNALVQANTAKAVADATLRTLVAAKADQASVDAAKANATKAAAAAEAVKRVAEVAAAQAEAQRVKMQAASLVARKAAVDKEEECKRLVQAAQAAATAAEADAKKANDLSVQGAAAAVAAAKTAQELSKVAADWTQKALAAAARTGQAQANYDTAKQAAVVAQKEVDDLAAQLKDLQNSPPADISTADLNRRINELQTQLAQAQKDWEDAKKVVADTQVEYEKQRKQEQTVINARQAANDALRAKLNELNTVQRNNQADSVTVRNALAEIARLQKEAEIAKKEAQAAWELYLATRKRLQADTTEQKRLEALVAQITNQNSAEFAAAQANLAKLRKQVQDGQQELDAALKDKEAKDKIAADLQAKLNAAHKDLSDMEARQAGLQTTLEANWRSVHQARNEMVGEFGRGPASTSAPTSAPTPAPTPAPTRAPTPPAKCNWRLNDGFDLRGTPLCKPGYTNLHPNNPNLRGRCKAQPDEAAKWCNADPNCDAVQCTAWNVPDEGCEPVSTKGATGVVDPVRGHKSAFICERTPKRPGVEYWPHFG